MMGGCILTAMRGARGVSEEWMDVNFAIIVCIVRDVSSVGDEAAGFMCDLFLKGWCPGPYL